MELIGFGEGVGYKSIPKVACTSIKKAIYKFENGADFNREDEGCHIHRYFNKRKKVNSVNCKVRVILLRDPIKRFLSAYSNRVCFHKELSVAKVEEVRPNLVNEMDVFNPGLGQFIDGITTYSKIPSIMHHIKPVSLAEDFSLSKFTDIFVMENIQAFSDFLSSSLGKPFLIGRSQTGGRKMHLQDLSRSHFDYLVDFYREDYAVMSKYYSIDKIFSEYKSGM